MSNQVRWTILRPIEIEPWFSKKLKATAEAFNVRIESVLQNRECTGRMLAEIEAADAASVDFANLSYPTHVECVAKDLQNELTLRREMVPFFSEHRAGLLQQYEKAHKEHLEIQERVRQQLLAIGYVDAHLSSQTIGKIVPGFLMVHPAVHAARGLADSFLARTSSHHAETENNKALDQVEQQLDHFRQRAMGQLGPARQLPPARPELRDIDRSL